MVDPKGADNRSVAQGDKKIKKTGFHQKSLPLDQLYCQVNSVKLYCTSKMRTIEFYKCLKQFYL
jgi:hypothetical protein